MTKKPMKLLSLLLSASLALGMGSFPVLAQEAEVTAAETAEAGETVSPDIENEDGEEFQETDLQEEEAAEDAAQAEEESLDESLDEASGEGEAEEEAADERAEEETVEQTEQADDAEAVEEPETVEESAAFEEPETADTAETVEAAPGTEEVVVTEPAAEAEAAAKQMTLVTIGGVKYYYVNTEGDAEDTVYQAVVRSGAGSTSYEFTIADLTQVSGTNYCYTVVAGGTPLSGTLYGYGEGTATNYKEVYENLGVSTDSDSAYDAVTSATSFGGYHAKDIPSLVTFGTSGGEKAITGLALGRTTTTVDALTFIEASVKQAAGKELSEEEATAAAVTLTACPMTAPSDKEISVKLAGAEGYQTHVCWMDGSHSGYSIVKPNVLYKDFTVAANHVSQMQVRAFYTLNGKKVFGPWSNVVFITPSPAGITMKNVSKGKDLKMQVSWKPVYGCHGYNVFITTNPNGKWSWNQSTAVKANATSAVITKCMGAKLKKNTRYYVRIVTRRKFKGVFCSVPMPAANTTTRSFIIK